ncbi:cilia- and flagella-associated protein 53 [Protopterus annectens]|uniref:cilia- and flagella-associated protein 53 n=1 Tax=Protopterus annectens TaxID=7888 RepID=UPI001CFB2BD0|nr:cilia- and flagella-associated protein 53 [Protopterus annectens]
MLVSQRTRPRCREVTGPTPHSVAVKAKFPSSRPADYLILERRRQEQAREQVFAFTAYQKLCDLKNTWEKYTDRQIMKATIERRVNDAMEQYRQGIEERRKRLQEMLEAEEQDYIREMESMEETTLERQAKMRERAKLLREKRERERQELAAEKREQQFREQCQELRSAMTRLHQNEVCTERSAQLALKEELRKQQKQEEEFFANIWNKDRLAKEEREKKEAEKQAELNRKALDVIQAQMAAAEAQKLEEKHLKEEEARLMGEKVRLHNLEVERAHLDKLKKQQQTRDNLEKSLRIKMKQEAREQQEELALDIKIMEQLLKDSHDDAEEQRQRKLQLREEQQRYRQYLAEQLEEQKRSEKEMDQLIGAELQKSWAKRVAQWKLDKEARDRLMKEVMETRQLQIQEKLDRNAKKQDELAADKELLAKAIEEHKHLEEERTAQQKKYSEQYQKDLIAQMEYQQMIRKAEKEENKLEYESGLVTEKAYQEKLKDLLSRPYVKEVHPWRRARISSPKDWLPA